METETQNLEPFRMEIVYGDRDWPEWARAVGPRRWTVTLERNGETAVVPFSGGHGVTDPQPERIIESLALDLHTAREYQDALDMAAEMGYPLDTNADRVSVRRTWNAVQAIAEALKPLLGEDLEEFVSVRERDAHDWVTRAE